MVGFSYEDDALRHGYRLVCGVDEAGRGPLAGPVVAAAVILPENWVPTGLDDSKKLTKKRREALYEAITTHAVSFGIASVDHEEIDRINILNATFLAMRKAVEQLSPAAQYALIDGNALPAGLPCPALALIKGDQISASIAAASVLAKVTRDRWMEDIATQYPEYGFEKHKGYPTALHRQLVRQLGPCPIHRLSFLKKIL